MKMSKIIIAVIVVVVVIMAVIAVTMIPKTTNNNLPDIPLGSTVHITTDFTFNPASVTIHLGENVTWINDAGIAHTIMSDDSTDPYSSGVLTSGHSFTHEFNSLGVFEYHCSIHPSMKGNVTVVA
jgi:plastocyanin